MIASDPYLLRHMSELPTDVLSLNAYNMLAKRYAVMREIQPGFGIFPVTYRFHCRSVRRDLVLQLILLSIELCWEFCGVAVICGLIEC